MLSLFINFLTNLLLVVFCFLVTMLAMLWAIGKQKSAARRRSSSLASRRYDPRNPFAVDNDNDADDVNNDAMFRRQNQQQHQQPYQTFMTSGRGIPSPRAPSPAVMPRRLSFSTATPVASTFQQQQQQRLSQSQHSQLKDLHQNSASNFITPRASNSTFGVGSGSARRVTFSLTPEQQQNEYDKQASANLARRRAPVLLSSMSNVGGLSSNANDIPLVELFPTSSTTPTSTQKQQQQTAPDISIEHQQQQDFFQLNQSQTASTPLSDTHTFRSLRQPPRYENRAQNPFMPTSQTLLRQRQLQNLQNQQHLQEDKPRRRPPPLTILT